MPQSRIPECKAFLLVDSTFVGEDYMYYFYPPLSGNTTCMNIQLYIT